MYFNNKNDVLDWIILIPCILHLARNANDDRLQDDDDGIQKLEKKVMAGNLMLLWVLYKRADITG
jgi:hypothetical protein